MLQQYLEKNKGNDLLLLSDASRAFPKVLLEQVIFVLRKGTKELYLDTTQIDEKGLSKNFIINKNLYNDFGVLLTGLSKQEIETGLKIRKANTYFSDV